MTANPIAIKPLAAVMPEQSLLSAILISQGGEGIWKATEHLSPQNLLHEKTTIIFSSMIRLAASGVTIDPSAIAIDLEQHGELAQAGGVEYLCYLTENVPTTNNIEHYAKLIKNNSNKRQLREKLHKCITLCETRPDGNVISEIQNDLRAAFEDLDDNSGEPFKLMTFGDIVEENPQLEIIISGLLEKKGALMIMGPNGIGKSLLVNTIALQGGLPGGGSLWGLFDIPKQLKTLIIQSENSMAATNVRLKKATEEDPGLKASLGNIFIPRIGNDCRVIGNFEDPQFVRKIEGAIKACKPDIVIWDPLISYHGSDENDSVKMRQSLDKLTALQDKLDFAVIVIHHKGKGEDNPTFSGRGSSAIGDWNGSALSFSRHKEDANVIAVIHEKSRNFPTVPDFFLERTEGCRITRLLDVPSSDYTKNMFAVESALKNLNGKATSEEILHKELELVMRKMGLRRTRTIMRNAIRTAIECGIVIKGTGSRRSKTYALKGDLNVYGPNLHQLPCPGNPE